MAREPLPVDLDKAILLYEAGMPLPEVASQLGVSRATVSRRFARAGYLIRGPGEAAALWWRKRDPQMQPLFDRYVAGESAKALAQEAKMGQHRFAALLDEAGIARRRQSEVKTLWYATMSDEGRRAITARANRAKRGKRANHWSLERRAATMERTLQLAGAADLLMAVRLAQHGLADFTLQKAIGPYNIDVAFEERLIAIEVNGAYHGAALAALSRSRSTPQERRQYIFDRGWRLIEVLLESKVPYLTAASTDRVVALVQQSRRDETGWGQYCVVGSDGEVSPGLES
jgi:very-short-patch-repair endonuclease